MAACQPRNQPPRTTPRSRAHTFRISQIPIAQCAAFSAPHPPRVLSLAAVAPLHRTKWFVYSKRPFAGPEQVLAYLSRYTHRVAISNSRLIAADATGVTFSYKDYRIEGPGRYKTMTLKPDEFIRRFLMHVLPNGFHRIRHCGLLASGTKTETIARIRELIATVAPVQTAHQPQPPDSAPATDQATHPCPCCGGRMNIIETFKRGSTPHHRPTGPIIAGRIDTS